MSLPIPVFFKPRDYWNLWFERYIKGSVSWQFHQSYWTSNQGKSLFVYTCLEGICFDTTFTSIQSLAIASYKRGHTIVTFSHFWFILSNITLTFSCCTSRWNMKAIFTILLFICLCLLGSSQAGGVSDVHSWAWITSYRNESPTCHIFICFKHQLLQIISMDAD